MALIGGILEIFGDVLLQLVLEVLAGVAERLLGRLTANEQIVRPLYSSVVYLFLGGVAGVLSVLVIPHRLARQTRSHGISLLISPLVTGAIMFQVGSFLRRAGKASARIESFANGFAFALGVAAIRFVVFR